MNLLSSLPSKRIHDRLLTLAASERKITAELIEFLAEADSRRLYAEVGYSSLFDYVTKCLGYSEGSAYRRINAARLLRQVPDIKNKIEEGSLKLTQVSQAFSMMRQSEKETHQKISVAEKKEILEKIEKTSARVSESVLANTLKVEARSFTEVKAMAAEKFEVRMTFSKEEISLIEGIKAQLSHNVPTQDLKDLFLYLCQKVKRNTDRLTEEVLVKTKQKSSKPIVSEVTANSEVGKKEEVSTSLKFTATMERRRVSAEFQKRTTLSPKIRIKLKARARNQCQWWHPSTGKRCECKSFLELDHVVPLALGGPDEIANLRVLCRQHNQFEAQQRGLS